MFFSFGHRDDSFSDAWLATLTSNVLLYGTLAADEQDRLRTRTARLIARLAWEGCAGQVIDDEVRVTIAGQAALLLLGLDEYCFDELHTVLVYPGRFLSTAEDELGHPAEVQMLLGQAAHDGPVALSWWHARWAGRRLSSGNVVLHEFAHKMAEIGDPQRACPPMVPPELRSRWHRVLMRECDQLADAVDRGRPTLIDPYGATSLPEFFAVVTETFFLQAAALHRQHGELYQLLTACYRQDPAQRRVPRELLEFAREAEREYSQQAIVECTAALRHRSVRLEAYQERAGHRLALGDVEGALEDWTTVLRHVRAPEEKAETLCERGLILSDLGRFEDAIADFTEAIRLSPEYAGAYAERGAVHAHRGDRTAALNDFDNAIRLDPDDDTARTQRAILYHETGNLPRALKDLDRAARLSPHDAEIYRLRGRVLLDMGELKRSLADAEEAVRLEPEEPESLRARAMVLERLGRSEEAQRDRIAADYRE